MSFDSSSANYLVSSDHATGEDLSLLRERFAGVTFELMLDVATGAGHCAGVFSAQRRILFDYSEKMLLTARGNLSGAEAVRGSASALPFADGVFPLVSCRLGLHHFPDAPAFFRELHRVLAPGGLFVLIDTVVDIEDAEFNALETVRDPSHVRIYTLPELLCMATGLRLEQYICLRKTHRYEEWARRLNPSEEHYQRIGKCFHALNDLLKKELAVVTDGDTIVSYTDKKGLSLFRKI